MEIQNNIIVLLALENLISKLLDTMTHNSNHNTESSYFVSNLIHLKSIIFLLILRYAKCI
jgi:hypothetical protein